MNVEFITKADLREFKNEMMNEIRSHLLATDRPRRQWLKSKEVREILGCSHGTLQNLRISGVLSPTKIGGSWYYSNDEINALLSNHTDFAEQFPQ